MYIPLREYYGESIRLFICTASKSYMSGKFLSHAKAFPFPLGSARRNFHQSWKSKYECKLPLTAKIVVIKSKKISTTKIVKYEYGHGMCNFDMAKGHKVTSSLKYQPKNSIHSSKAWNWYRIRWWDLYSPEKTTTGLLSGVGKIMENMIRVTDHES